MTKGNNYSNMIVASSSHSNRSELPELKQQKPSSFLVSDSHSK